jgi:predicted nucleic acid-binding protein
VLSAASVHLLTSASQAFARTNHTICRQAFWFVLKERIDQAWPARANHCQAVTSTSRHHIIAGSRDGLDRQSARPARLRYRERQKIDLVAGTPIGPYDVLIAAQARLRHAALVTANTGEFAGVPGLRTENWAVA